MGEAFLRIGRIMGGVVALAVAGAVASPTSAASAAADLGMTLLLQKQARLQATAYGEVRAAVEDGRRPAADLEAARRSLKAAQTALYDQAEETQHRNAVFYEKLRRQNDRRLTEELATLRAQEEALAALPEGERPAAEARLQLSRQIVEGYRENALRLAARPPAPRRPKLPILPPRT